MSDIFATIQRLAEMARNTAGDPSNSPAGALGSDTGLPPETLDQINSARIIEDLVEIYGKTQENNRMSSFREQSPSSRTNNLLKNMGVSLPASVIGESVLTPINGLYGIVLRSEPGDISSQDFSTLTPTQIARRNVSSVWARLSKAALTGTPMTGASILPSDEPEESNPAATLDVLRIPTYVVFIFANITPRTPIPVIEEADNVLSYQNDLSYPRAVLTNMYVRRDNTLKPGTLIRINYDGQDNKQKAVITEIIEDDPAFTRLVMNSMKDRSALLASTACSTDSFLSGVSHPSGDAISGDDPAVVLHNAYIALERAAGEPNIVSELALYVALFNGLGDAKLALGILANAKKESAFNSSIVSRAATESSIGLWQFNVQNPGYFSIPNSDIRQRADSALPESIKIPTNQRVVPYFAGGLLLKSLNLTAVTPTTYDGTQDLAPLYEAVSNANKQTAFVIATVKSMLETIEYNPDDISASNWAEWFQIYFEQPGKFNPRGPVAVALASELREAGATIPV